MPRWLARPAYEDRFLATFSRIKRYRTGIPVSTRAPESSGGARVGTRPDQPELAQGASARKLPSLAISVCALACPPVLCITLANLPCLYFAGLGARGVCGRVGAAARSSKDGVKGHYLNFETGAGVKYRSSSAPASVISGRLIYPSSPSGQRSDFTNPKTCSCSSMSFSMIHQSQPFTK
jgi:hypothetical protein